jgi:PUB domain
MLRELLTGAGMDCTELSSDSTTLQFMRSTYSGAEGLAATTLASIGLSGGSAMFTLTGAEGTFSDTAATAGATAGAGTSSATDSPARAVLPAKRQVEESSSSTTGASPVATHAALSPSLLHVPAAAVVAAVTHPEPYTGTDAPHAEEFMKPAPRSVRSTSSSSAASAAAAGAAAAAAAAAAAGADVMDVDDDAASSVTSGGGDFDRYSTVSVAGSDASALLARMQDVDAMAVVDSSANSNYNSSSSSSGAAAMDADEQQQQQLDDSAMGLAVCEAALETLKSSHFDADVLDCVLTLLKYIDGVAQRPGDARTRSIKLSNAAYKQKVSTALYAVTSKLTSSIVAALYR